MSVTRSMTSMLPTGPDAYTLENMSQEVVTAVEARLRPGAYSGLGFISANESLREVVRNDLQTLARLGITCEQISDTMRGIIKKAKQVAEDMTNVTMIGNRFKVTGFNVGTNGYQECPFHKTDEICHKGRKEIVVTNRRFGESVAFTDLAIALIGNHGFFEGNVPNRVDPETICRVLEIKPDDYKKITEKTWKYCTGGELDEGAEKAAKKYAEKVCQIEEHVTAYLGLPYQDHEKYEDRGLTVIEAIRKNKKGAEIDESIEFNRKFIRNWNPDAPVFVDDGKKYCHLFIHEDRENAHLIIDGGSTEHKMSMEGYFVFEPIVETYAEISPWW